MRANEALEVLGLDEGATAATIKEAYRDLVKVWHPDRFGSDTRLREKAEDKLKEINLAYRTLLAGDGAAAAGPSAPATNAAPRPAETASPSDPRPTPSRQIFSPWWLYVAVALLVGGFVIYAVHSARSLPDEDPAATQTVDAPVAAPATPSTASRASGGTAPPGFAVRSLTEEQSAQVDADCAAQRDPVAHANCVSAKLKVVTKTPGPPSLASLSTSEKESIESVCAGVKRFHGEPAYNACLTAQMADWAAEPARVDFSGVSEADHASIETACSGAKQQGPAVYDRCRSRLVRTLTQPN